MTRRAHNVDRERTENAKFLDSRSYWTNDGHEFLFGGDILHRREQVFDRDLGRCQRCRLSVRWNEFHMHHKRGGLVGRCTCLHNLETLCPLCHRNEHVQVRSGTL